MLTDAQRQALEFGIARRNTRGMFTGTGGPNDMLRKALQKIVSGWIALGGPSGAAMEALATYLLTTDTAHRAAVREAVERETQRCADICAEEWKDVDSHMYRSAAGRIGDRIRMEAGQATPPDATGAVA